MADLWSKKDPDKTGILPRRKKVTRTGKPEGPTVEKPKVPSDYYSTLRLPHAGTAARRRGKGGAAEKNPGDELQALSQE